MKEKWVVAAKRADFNAIGARFGIDPVLARILRNRDLLTEEEIERYLNGGLADLHDPSLLKGSGRAIEILVEKIHQRKKIRIIGDYDIDGVNASYILYKALSHFTDQLDFEIPDRMRDGFGLNRNLIHYAAEEGIDTILTCDNGIAAMDSVRYAKECGMTVIITDHHEPNYEDTNLGRIYQLPPADALVNPKQPGCPYPFKEICGAVVAWKLMQLLYEAMGLTRGDAVREFLEFAAIATVGDVMTLRDENRIIVKEGLKKLRVTQNAGLSALLQAVGLQDKDLTAYHIGFVIGPCINASGRLETAKFALRLLLEENTDTAAKMAQRLKDLNDQRKEMTETAIRQACEMIESSDQLQDRVLVVYLPDCHESIAGIVAGKIRERYYRPVFVVTDGQQSAKGSGRSIEAYSMFEEMVRCQDLFLKFGGHPMAAGFSLRKEDIPEMRRRLNENTTLTQEDLIEKIVIDVPMPISYIREDLINSLNLLEPFGKGNEKPVFAEKNLKFLSLRILGKTRKVLKFEAANSQGCIMEALYFGDADQMLQDLRQTYGEAEIQNLRFGRQNSVRASVLYYPSVNEYMGRKTLQIIIRSYQL